MTWFGKVSAWAGVVSGVLLLALAALHYSAGGMTPWAVALAGVLLLVGSFRTLRAMSGGLRLLAGAWGVALGLMAAPAFVPAAAAYAIIAAAGLALTVLHKERK